VKAEASTAGVAERLAGLVSRYELDDRQRTQLEGILATLAEGAWSPTAVRDPAQAVDVHLADSLVALEVEALVAARDIADLGSGAGFPGAVLAVARPAAEVRLIESQRRKCSFMAELCARAGIANARTVCTRAEEWAEGMGANEVVLARALAAPATVVEYAAPLLRVGGALIDWRGRLERGRVDPAVGRQLGMELVEIRHVQPHVRARDHHLHIYVKNRDTPQRFPRRPGVAQHRPLSGA
jgi:16S rRNA (guanine527-N7)-methyltransferase